MDRLNLFWTQRDHVLSDIECLALYKTLTSPSDQAGWAFSASSRGLDHQVPFARHWQTFVKCAHDSVSVIDVRLPLCNDLIRRCELVLGKGPLLAERIYINGYTAGQFPRIHRDDTEINHLTALFFINPVWEIDWHGETLLYNEVPDEVMHCSALIRRAPAIHAARANVMASAFRPFTIS